MIEIITLTLCLAPYVSKTQLKQLRHIMYNGGSFKHE